MDENAKHPAGAKVEATYYPCTITASYTVTLKDVSKIEEDASAVLPLYVPITIGVKNTDEQDVSNANQIKVDFKTASCGAKDKGDTPIRVRSAVAAAVAELRPNLPIPQKLILENKILENLSIKDHL